MLHVIDAGQLSYRPAWDLQLQVHEKVMAGEHADGALLLLEHPPVITIGRRADAEAHLLVPRKMLEARGVELIETDRGGDITFHGPGQLVVYPIIPLNRYGLNLHSYLRLLEQVIINSLAHFGIAGKCDTATPPATGVWVQHNQSLAKIAAIGIKVRRWTTLHGLALNVSTDLSYFELINPCGLSRPVTSMQKVLGAAPAMAAVRQAITDAFQTVLNTHEKLTTDARG